MPESNFIPASPFTLEEAATVSNLPIEQVNTLFPNGTVSLREALYAALLFELPIRQPDYTLSIARTAASEARLNGSRVLLVGFEYGEPILAWMKDTSETRSILTGAARRRSSSRPVRSRASHPTG